MSSEPPDPAALAGPAQESRDPGGNTPVRQLLEQCWGLVDDELLLRSTEIFRQVARACLREGEEGPRCFARAVATEEKQLVGRYRSALRAAFEAQLAGLGAPKRSAPPVGGLALVDFDQAQLGGDLELATARLRELVRESLEPVQLRLQALTGAGDGDADFPLRPALFLRAVADALVPAVTPTTELAAILRQFPVALADPLRAVYRGLARLLDARGVAAAPAEARGAAPATAVTQAPPAGPPDADSFIEYERLQALNGINAAPLLEAALAGLAGHPAPLAAPSAALIEALRAGQKADAAQLVGAEGARAAAFTGTREHSRRLIGLALDPVHKLCIQLTARLFARLERDPLIPPALRELLVLLRFPVLELALSDTAWLIRPAHPARLLLNAIASAAPGWMPEAPNAHRHLQQARLAVQFVLLAPGGAPAACAQAHARYAAFLAGDTPLAEKIQARALQALHDAEAQERRATDIAAFLREILDGATMPDYLRELLYHVWPRVLLRAREREPRHPGALRKLLNVIPDLVGSVQPPQNAAERKHLVETIPGVLSGLRLGLQLVGYPDEQRQGLLEQLMQLHAQVLKAVERPAGAPSGADFSVSTVRIRLDGWDMDQAGHLPPDWPIDVLEESVRDVLRASRSGVSHRWPRAQEIPAAHALTTQQAQVQIAAWREKTWFHLRVGQTMRRVRLECFTPSRSLALFSSRRGDALYSLSQAGLAGYLGAGWIGPVETAPLLARAFVTLLADLQKSAQAAGEVGHATR